MLLTGHVTKDGDLAGPRALEHAVDVVLTFDGDPRSGLRVLAGGKNRFGAEGESAWFEMGGEGLREIDPTDLLVSGERVARGGDGVTASGTPGARGRGPGAGRLGRRPGPPPGDGARPSSVPAGGGGARPGGRDPARPRRAVRSVLGGCADRRSGLRPRGGGRARLRGDRRSPRPPARRSSVRSALTGLVRPAPAMAQRFAAARAAGCSAGLRPRGRRRGSTASGSVPVRHVREAAELGVPGRRRRRARHFGVDRSDPSRPRNSPLTCGFGLRRKEVPCYPLTSQLANPTRSDLGREVSCSAKATRLCTRNMARRSSKSCARRNSSARSASTWCSGWPTATSP